MVFSSLLFLFLFLPLNLILYYSTKNKDVRNIILVVFSLIFYAWGEPVWVILLIFSAFIDYLNGLFIEKYHGTKYAKLGIISTLIFNLGILFTFKYSDFIIENINAVLQTNIDKPGFMLPIGISFYTFQTISYTIDVYRGEIKAQRKFLHFLMFVSLYHQLVAGPIVRYSHIAKEIEERYFEWNDFSSGVTRFCKGLFKKVAIANIAGSIAMKFLDVDFSNSTVIGSWFGLLLYTLQIYFDFSGYSDMAIGLGRMFGFHYFENFKHPYISKSITEFWRRWHISLGTFFKDYLYIPLGGNKKSQYRNIVIVWLCTGLWHGASWNFILWGVYFGFWLILEKLFIKKLFEKVHVIIQHVYSIIIIVFGWAIFYYTDIHQLSSFIKIIAGFSDNPLSNMEVNSIFMNNIYWLILSLALCMPVYSYLQNMMIKKIANGNVISGINISINIVLLIISVTLLVGSTYNPFLYFRF